MDEKLKIVRVSYDTFPRDEVLQEVDKQLDICVANGYKLKSVAITSCWNPVWHNIMYMEIYSFEKD